MHHVPKYFTDGGNNMYHTMPNAHHDHENEINIQYLPLTSMSSVSIRSMARIMNDDDDEAIVAIAIQRDERDSMAAIFAEDFLHLSPDPDHAVEPMPMPRASSTKLSLFPSPTRFVLLASHRHHCRRHRPLGASMGGICKATTR